MIAPDNVLEFWFKDDHTLFRAEWFVANSAFDATCTSFAEALQAARNGSLDQWADTPRGMLALIVLLDQFSRNLHRGSPEAYAADAQARALARDAVSRGARQGGPSDGAVVPLSAVRTFRRPCRSPRVQSGCSRRYGWHWGIQPWSMPIATAT